MATVQEMQAQKDKNSAAWHGASADEQNRLHQANLDLQKQIDAANKTTTVFDSGSGTYKPSTGTGGGNGGASGVPTPTAQGTTYKAPGTDDLGKVDYSKSWDSALSSGADYDTLKGIYDARNDKISGGGAYGQFAGDAKSQEMKAALDRMYQEQKNAEREAYLKEMARQQQAAALADLRAAYNKNVAGLDRAQAGIAPQYQSARNEAAGQAELQKKNFAEYAAANGLNSGAGGQAQLSFANALQNNLSGIAQKEASTMADLELQRSQMETDYNNAIAQAKAQGNYQLAQQLYQEKVRQDEQMLSQMQWQAQQDLQNQQFQFNKDQANVGQGQWQQNFDKGNEQYSQQWALKMAQEMAQYGNFDGYKALGYSDSEIQSMKDYWSWMQQQSTSKSAQGGGNGGSGVGKLTAAQALSAYNNGYDTPEIRAVIEPVYGKLWGTDGGGTPPAMPQIPQAVMAELTRLEDTRNPTTQIYNAIKRFNANGTIDDTQAQELLKRYGMG